MNPHIRSSATNAAEPTCVAYQDTRRCSGCLFSISGVLFPFPLHLSSFGLCVHFYACSGRRMCKLWFAHVPASRQRPSSFSSRGKPSNGGSPVIWPLLYLCASRVCEKLLTRFRRNSSAGFWSFCAADGNKFNAYVGGAQLVLRPIFVSISLLLF